MLSVSAVNALANDTLQVEDSIIIQEIKGNKDIIVQNDTLKKNKTNFFGKVIGYFNESNKEKKDKKFDVNFIGGPHYATDTKLGLGLVGAGLYRIDKNDYSLLPSNVSLVGDISTVGFYLIGINGTNIFPKDKYRLNYVLYFFSFPSWYWGIGYDNGNNNDNKTKMKRFQTKIKAEFLFKLAKNLYLGPALSWEFVKTDSISKPWLLNEMPLHARNYAMGFTASYDSRNSLTNPSKGFLITWYQMFKPKWLWNDNTVCTTDIKASYYVRAWSSGIITSQIRGLFNTGNPSWGMMANLGDSNSMRGYYEGRYRDKNMITAQVELRQHVWRRNGVVVWVGAGNVFHDSYTFKKILPNYGFGYRWEFKKNMNLRIDFGFGKSDQNGFLFQINEAF